MVSANLEVTETIKCDYTNTECFWRLNEITKNIVLVTRDEGREIAIDGIRVTSEREEKKRNAIA